MQQLLPRIATFSSWPATSTLSPFQLANCGFYYSGKNDEVICFTCNTHIDRWSANDNPQERHRQVAPDCPFVKGNSSGNSGLSRINQPDRTFRTNNIDTIDTPTVTVNADIDVGRTVAQDPNYQLYRNVFDRGKRNDFQRDLSLPDFEKLRHKEERLRTFSDWPASAQADPEALAHAGFFYTGSEDRVQCAFCRGFVHSWKSTDSPATEHKAHFPECMFARSVEVGNVPVRDLPPVENGIRNQNDGESWNNGSHPATELVTALTAERALRLPRRTELPKHPQYTELFLRIQSFRSGIVSHGQTATNLAEAGWFYIGPGDKVLCFHCGGNLKDWEYEDDPWVEHEKWYPDCVYLLNHRPVSRVQMPKSTPQTLSNGLRYFESREIKARLDTAATRLVLEMGYSKDLVKSAIEKRMCTTGDDFPNVESLLEAIFALEDGATLQSNASSLPRQSTTTVVPMGTSRLEDNNRESLEYAEENRRLREARICKVCVNDEVDTVLLPCGHLVVCNKCSPRIRNCPICNTFIRGTVKTFLS